MIVIKDIPDPREKLLAFLEKNPQKKEKLKSLLCRIHTQNKEYQGELVYLMPILQTQLGLDDQIPENHATISDEEKSSVEYKVIMNALATVKYCDTVKKCKEMSSTHSQATPSGDRSYVNEAMIQAQAAKAAATKAGDPMAQSPAPRASKNSAVTAVGKAARTSTATAGKTARTSTATRSPRH